MVGRTKTAPAGDPTEVRFAVVSCNNYQGGFFTAFARIAERDSLDAVVHLGDYIYEYGGDTTIARFHKPTHEIVTLEDYRIRYAQYRLDKDLVHAHQQHPFITIWDDHEIANNSYKEGAQNHQPDEEGNYEARKQAARQAYFEWMPVREQAGGQLYRSFSFGDLASLIMLDERLEGRSAPAESIDDPAYQSEERDMLGEEQFNWLSSQLKDTSTQWKVIGNQVIFSDLDISGAFPERARNLDAWDGYPAAKQRVVDVISSNNLEDVIFLTGDTHTSWAFEVAPEPTVAGNYDMNTGEGAIAIEFGTPSISSSNYDERMPLDSARMIAGKYMDVAFNPHLKYVDLTGHGYLLLTLDTEKAVAEWYYVGDISRPGTEEELAKALKVEEGTHHIINREDEVDL
jgi:alkaline phosphatase D